MLYWILNGRKRDREGEGDLCTIFAHSHCFLLPNHHHLGILDKKRNENRHTIITMGFSFYNSFFYILYFGCWEGRWTLFRPIRWYNNNGQYIDNTRILSHTHTQIVIKITKIMFDLKGFSSLCRKIDTHTIWFMQHFCHLFIALGSDSVRFHSLDFRWALFFDRLSPQAYAFSYIYFSVLIRVFAW